MPWPTPEPGVYYDSPPPPTPTREPGPPQDLSKVRRVPRPRCDELMPIYEEMLRLYLVEDAAHWLMTERLAPWNVYQVDVEHTVALCKERAADSN